MGPPPISMINLAMLAAAKSPCDKSRRGAVLYLSMSSRIFAYGAGCNGQPPPMQCTRTDPCRQACGRICRHAEARAIRSAMVGDRVPGVLGPLELVHVKIDPAGLLVAGEGPSCAQCSTEILDTEWIGGIWLYQTPESIEAMPLLAWPEGLEFRGIRIGGVPPPHDAALIRDSAGFDQRAEPPRWVRYTALEFHRATLLSQGLLP